MSISFKMKYKLKYSVYNKTLKTQTDEWNIPQSINMSHLSWELHNRFYMAVAGKDEFKSIGFHVMQYKLNILI